MGERFTLKITLCEVLPNQLIPDTPDIDELDIRVSLEVMAQLGYENVKAAAIENIIIAPYFL